MGHGLELGLEQPHPGAVRLGLPSATPWNRVSFYLVDGETVAVRAPGMQQRRLSYRDLGMADGRGGKPTKRWRLIEKICEGHGECAWRSLAPSFQAFKTLVSDTRPVLQHIFGIQADPFPECTRNGLRAAFVAGPDLPDEPYVGEDTWARDEDA